MEAKYFYILSYKHEIDYKGLSYRQRDMPNNKESYVEEQINLGLVEGAWL